MANIDTYLQAILEAVYGEEVRGSIHDAIEAMNNEIEVWTGLQDGSVTTRKIASEAVTTAKIDDGAVTFDKLSSGAQSRVTSVEDQLEAMKTGFDGEEYDSPAAMVQGEDQKLQDEIDVLNRFKNTLGYYEGYVYPTNRFNKNAAGVANGYSFNSNGVVTENANFFITDYIPVVDMDGVKAAYATTNVQYVGSYYVCYDDTKTKIGSRNTTKTDGTKSTFQTGTVYIRCAYNVTRKDGFMVMSGDASPTAYEAYTDPTWVSHSSVIDDINDELDSLTTHEVTVGTGQTYTSILEALKGTDANVTLHLMAQEFDITAEYESYYGSSFWSNYDGYSEHSDDPFYRGLWLADGRRIYGEAGTKIKFTYSGNNSAVHTYFSVFANGKNTCLENVEIFVNQNVRYSIHDDFKPADGSVSWKNIIFHGSPHSSSHIGAGLGYGATYYLDGLVFLENNSLYDISYHGVATSNPYIYINKVYVRNCYGTKACAFRWYGPNTGVSPCVVSGSTFGSIYCEAYDPDQTVENMVLYKYNCVETDNAA